MLSCRKKVGRNRKEKTGRVVLNCTSKMAAAGRPQKNKKLACSHNAYHRKTERNIDRKQKKSEREDHFHEHSQHCGDPDLCMASFILLLTAISFHVPVPRVRVLIREMSPRHKHDACCELRD